MNRFVVPAVIAGAGLFFMMRKPREREAGESGSQSGGSSYGGGSAAAGDVDYGSLVNEALEDFIDAWEAAHGVGTPLPTFNPEILVGIPPVQMVSIFTPPWDGVSSLTSEDFRRRLAWWPDYTTRLPVFEDPDGTLWLGPHPSFVGPDWLKIGERSFVTAVG